MTTHSNKLWGSRSVASEVYHLQKPLSQGMWAVCPSEVNAGLYELHMTPQLTVISLCALQLPETSSHLFRRCSVNELSAILTSPWETLGDIADGGSETFFTLVIRWFSKEHIFIALNAKASGCGDTPPR